MRYAIAAVVGLIGGGVLGYLLALAIGLTAMAVIPYQDTPPDYSFIPYIAGLVLGPVLAVLWVRKRRTTTGS